MPKRLILALLLAGSLTGFAAHNSTPTSHLIQGVPWHVQMNGLFCGDGSLASVFDFYGPDLDQKQIADVARSSSIGTWSADIRRAGHFSCLSAAQGRYFPNEAPSAGFPERPLGYAAFSHNSDTLWLDELKALLRQDLPVILLMHYDADSTSGGHYRVAVGYDDAQQVIYFVDPWGRDLKYLAGDYPGLIAWTYDEVAVGWNYVAYGTDKPFWGCVIVPWNVDIRVKGKKEVGNILTVTAMVQYPCPAPFDPTEFPATSCQAQISLPPGTELVGTGATQNLGTMQAGNTRSVTWKITVNAPIAGTSLSVTAHGLVNGDVPEAAWQGQSQSYPSYSYTDAIGGSATLGF